DSVKLNAGDAAIERMRILDFDAVSGASASIDNFELAPKAWNARIESQPIALQFETQDVFQRGSVHPSRRTCVPGPPATAGVRRHGVNVGGGDVGLDFVFVQTGARRSVIDRIQQSEQFARAIAVAEHRECNHRPKRRVRVLSAVFAHAWDVAFDVAGIQLALIERGSEQTNQSIAAPDQVLFDGGHGARRTMRFGYAGHDGPGLSN